MAVELINIGQFANDGTGDDLREAMIKINNNFEDLDLRNDEKTTAVNLGTAGEGIFSRRNVYELEFKRIVAGTDITLTSNQNQIVVNANGGMKRLLVQSDSGSIILEETSDIVVSGGDNISTKIEGNVLTVDYTGPTSLAEDNSPTLTNNLDANGNNLLNVGTVDAALVTGALQGNLNGTVHGVDIRDINQYFDNYFDFGVITKQFTSILEWAISETVVDMGTLTQPAPGIIDAGSINP